MRKTIKQLNYILTSREKGKLILLFFLMLIGGILEMLGVSLVFPMIGMITGDQAQNTDKIAYMAILLIVVYAIKNIFLIVMYNAIFRYVYNGASDLSTRVMNMYLHADYSIHLKKNVAEIERMIRYDSDSVYMMMKAMLQLIAEGLICTVLAVFLLLTDVWMSLFLIILIGSVCGVFLVVSKKKAKKLGMESVEYSGQTGKAILQAFGGIKEVKLLGREAFFLDRLKDYRYKQAKVGRKQQILFQIPRLMVETICIAGVMIIILYNIFTGRDIIQLIPKLSVFAVAAFRLLPSVGKINSLLSEVMFYKAATDAVFQELNELEKINVLEKKEQNKGEQRIIWTNSIEALDLSFRYSVEGPEILSHCSITIPRGYAIGLIGPSGAGKTTVADLLMGMLSPTSGTIQVDGMDIQTNLRGWQNQIGYVPQSIYLSDDTIRANVAFGLNKQDIEDDKVWDALKQAQIDEFIRKDPNGLDAEVGDRGVRLSGGQRQRIGIARALYHNPELLIFDEATSALDNDTEEAVMQSIESLHGCKTMIIIAHRLSTIEKCDVVYKVENNMIIQVKDKRRVKTC